jgi:hypothetical protein
MRVKIDRGLCPVQREFCEHCPGKLLTGRPGHQGRCFLTYDDSNPELFSIELCMNDEFLSLKTNEHQRQQLMSD